MRASSQANAKCGRLRRCVPAWNTRPVRRIVSASIRLCAMFFVQGFSQYMSLPALAAFIAAVACQFGPVAISTASISLRSSSSRKSRYMSQFSLPYFSIGDLLDRRAAGRLHVADGDELHVLLLQEAAEVVGAAVADADAAEHDPLAGGDGAVPAEGGAGNDCRRHHRGPGRKRGLQKLPPMKMRLRLRHELVSGWVWPLGQMDVVWGSQKQVAGTPTAYWPTASLSTDGSPRSCANRGTVTGCRNRAKHDRTVLPLDLRRGCLLPEPDLQLRQHVGASATARSGLGN